MEGCQSLAAASRSDQYCGEAHAQKAIRDQLQREINERLAARVEPTTRSVGIDEQQKISTGEQLSRAQDKSASKSGGEGEDKDEEFGSEEERLLGLSVSFDSTFRFLIPYLAIYHLKVSTMESEPPLIAFKYLLSSDSY